MTPSFEPQLRRDYRKRTDEMLAEVIEGGKKKPRPEYEIIIILVVLCAVWFGMGWLVGKIV